MQAQRAPLTQNMTAYRVTGDPLIEMAHNPRLSPDAAEHEAAIWSDGDPQDA